MIEQIKTYRVSCDDQRYPYRGEGPRCLGEKTVQAPSKREALVELERDGWIISEGWHPRYDAKMVPTLQCTSCQEIERKEHEWMEQNRQNSDLKKRITEAK